MIETRDAIEAVWRIESAKLIAGLARIVRDVGLAEELAQDALVEALEQWPTTGIPRNPGAWLMTTAKRRGIDQLRRRATLERKHGEIGRELRVEQSMALAAFEATGDDDVGDDLLRLIFTACHPVLSREARVALTLRLLGGLTTDEIARAFLVPETTIAQRIVRAKRTLSEARVPFEVPRADELASRLASVLEVVYLIFNEGYSATAGDDWMRPGAVRRGAASRPDAGRARARRARGARARRADGDPGVALGRPDRPGGRADPAPRPGPGPLGPAPDPPGPGRPGACRTARRRSRARTGSRPPSPPATRGPRPPEATDWVRLAALYDALAALAPSPIVEVNRAVAVGMAFGPAAGLAVDRPARRRPGAQGLPPAAGRPRRPPRQARPGRGGGRGVPPGGRADAQRTRAAAPAGTGR